MNFLKRAFSFDRLVGLALLTGLLVVYAADPYPVKFTRNKTFDFYQKLTPRPIPAPNKSPIIIIDLDEESLNEIGQWPWPRNIIAEMVKNLFVMGVGVVGFDMAFPEPDRMNPTVVANSLAGLDEETKLKLAKLPGNDEAFANILRQTRVVLGQAAYWEKLDTAKGPPVKKSVAVKKLNKNSPDPRLFLPTAPSLVRSIPILEQATAHKMGGHGIFSLVPEIDGIVRRVPAMFVYDGHMFPALSIEMLRLATGRQTVLLEVNQAGINAIAIAKGLKIPTDSIGRIYPYFSKSDKAKYIQARDILNGTVDPSRIKGKLALVGTSAVGLLDIRAIPTEGVIPGVEVHAQVIENALEKSYLTRPNYANAAELFLILVGGMIMIILVPWVGAKWALLVFTVIATGAGSTSWYMFTEHKMLFDAAFAVTSILLLYTTLTFTGYAREESQRRATKDAFSKYLSPDMVSKVAENPNELKLGGETREMTLLFCDVRGFTTISEQFTPEGLTSLINKLLTPLTGEILERHGTVDKYMGDCIMAFWNAPLDDPDHARNGCLSALAMLEDMAPLNALLKKEAEEEGRKHIPLKVGIGLNTGTAVVGNMGSEQRFDYSVLGDTVNTASRLEGQSKGYHLDVVIGEETYNQVPDLATLELDLIQVKGKTEAVRIFTLIGDETMAQKSGFSEFRKTHADAIAAYRAQDWQGAHQHVAHARELTMPFYNMNGYYDLLEERISEFEADPPGADWDGVYVATSK